jgi:hypothetical protein
LGIISINDTATKKKTDVNNSGYSVAPVYRITALWALSEATFGGFLHALRIPFTGLFIGSSAVIFIILIAYFSEKPGTILRSTMIVLIIKGLVSPHTPQTAYIAISIQGLLGEILFFRKRFFLLQSVILGILSLVQSALQKIIILTLVFGKTLWESLDILGNFILTQLSIVSSASQNLPISMWLIGIYVTIHLLAGITAGILAAKIPLWITQEKSYLDKTDLFKKKNTIMRLRKSHTRKPWWQRPTGVFIIVISAAIVILSYFIPDFDTHRAGNVLIMIIRSILILLIWYIFVGPLFSKFIRKLLSQKKKSYGWEIEHTLAMLPIIKKIIIYIWRKSNTKKGINRIKFFLTSTIYILLTVEIREE